MVILLSKILILRNVYKFSKILCFVSDKFIACCSYDKWTTTLNDKHDDFDFEIANFPYLCNIIPLSPAYIVCISPS
jgi:hypothetical protein